MHEKRRQPKTLVAKQKAKKKGLKEDSVNTVHAMAAGKRFCYKCGDPDHISTDCPHKEKIAEYTKKLRAGSAHSITSFTLPCFVSRSSESRWILDSGSSQHITNTYNDLVNVVNVPRGEMMFTVGNDEVMVPTHVGSVKFGTVTLTDVYFCASCPVCLVSESRLVESGASVLKHAKDKSCLVTKNGVSLFEAKLEDKLFVLQKCYDGTGMSSVSSFC